MKCIFSLIKKEVLGFYFNTLEGTILDSFLIRLENIKKILPTNIAFTNFEDSGKALECEFLMATQSKGLLFYNKGRIHQLFSEKGFYGVSQLKGEHFSFCKKGLHGNIISFQIQGSIAINVRTRIFGLSRGVHQIDFINDDLFVTDTYNNSILIYRDVSTKNNVHWKEYDEILYPNGELFDGRQSSNYCHFNSIYKFKNEIFLVAHNETIKTGKASEAYLLSDKSLQVTTKSNLQGSNCHNFYKDSSFTVYLKSLEGVVSVNNEDVIKHKNTLLRGLSVSDDYIIVGGSGIELDRVKRDKTNGYVYIYDYNYKLLLELVIFGTQMQEIRRMQEEELAYSNNG